MCNVVASETAGSPGSHNFSNNVCPNSLWIKSYYMSKWHPPVPGDTGKNPSEILPWQKLVFFVFLLFYWYVAHINVTGGVILKTIQKYLTLVKLDERVRRPSQRSNVLLKVIRIIYLIYMCVTCVNHVTRSSNVLDQNLVCRLWRY